MKLKLLIFMLIMASAPALLNAAVGLNFGLYYNIPLNSTFRNEFYTDIPYISPEFGLTYRVNKDLYLNGDISFRSRAMSLSGKGYNLFGTSGNLSSGSKVEEVVELQPGNFSSEDIRFNIIPITLTATHYFGLENKVVPYVSLGVADYSVFFTNTYSKTVDNGNTVGKYSKTSFYNGPGIAVDLGLCFKTGINKYFGISIRYDNSFIGKAINGGLGNVGGVSLRLKYNDFPKE